MSELEWVPGRAFVYAEMCQIEYFYQFEEYGSQIRSYCGGLRPKRQCRPLDYVCHPRYLGRDFDSERTSSVKK